MARACAVLALASFVGCSAPADPPRPALLPDVGDPPRLVMLSLNSARRATLRNADLVTNLVNGLSPSTRFLILTNDRPAFTIARNDRPDRVRFLEVPASDSLTIWTQDPFLVLAGGDGEAVLLTSKAFERADDRLMASVVAQTTGYRLRHSALSFEGGNIVSDERHVLVGADTVRRNAVDLRLPETEVVMRFEEEVGRPALVIGPSPQPIAHIDMMLTPLGDGRLLLADPAAGADIAEQALEEDPESVAAFERWCEEHFFGHPSIQKLPGPAGPVTPPQISGRTRDMIEKSRALAPVLQQVASSLEQHGYRVERIPLLYGGPEADPSLPEDERGLRAAYPMLTYNNVLLESDATGRRVYVPRYGWPEFDQAAFQAWHALGFDTRPIDGVTISAMYGGAVRCALKVLLR
jgi:hypothetical protein